MATRYGLTGNWSATTTWSATSGGTSGASVPTSSDDVIFDASSGAITVDVTASTCRSIDCTGYTNTFTIPANVQLVLGGSTANGTLAIKFVAAMTLTMSTSSASIKFTNTSGTVLTIALAGKTINTLNFNGAGGSWQFQDSIVMASSGNLSVLQGTVDLNGLNHTVGSFNSTGSLTRRMIGATGTITIVGTGTFWNVSGSGLTTTDWGSLSVWCTTGFTSSRTFSGNNIKIGTLWFHVSTTGALILSGANTVGTLSVINSTVAQTVTMPSGSTLTVDQIDIRGSAARLLTLNASTAGTQATISSTSATGKIIGSDYLVVQDINFVGTAGTTSWYAGANSTNTSNNTGITFAAPALTAAETGTNVDALSSVALGTLGNIADVATGTDALISFSMTRTDSGSGADSVSLIAPTFADTSTAADTVTIASSASASDAGTGSDATTLLAFGNTADTGVGSDAASFAATLSASDAGGGSDAVTPAPQFTLAESGTGTDAIAPHAISFGDTMTGTDAISGTALTFSEAGSGVDAVTPFPLLSRSDTSSVTDAIMQNALTFAESSSVLDAFVLSLLTSDAGSGTEAILLIQIAPASETADFAEGARLFDFLFGYEDISAADALSIAITTIRADAATGSDSVSLSPLFTLAETGSGFETVSPSPQFTVSDSGAASDSVTPFPQFTLPEAGTGVDSAAPGVSHSVFETVHGTDVLSALLLSVADAATLADSIAIAIPVSEAGAVAEALGAIGITAADAVAGSDGASLLVLIPAAEFANFVDAAAFTEIIYSSFTMTVRDGRVIFTARDGTATLKARDGKIIAGVR